MGLMVEASGPECPPRALPLGPNAHIPRVHASGSSLDALGHLLTRPQLPQEDGHRASPETLPTTRMRPMEGLQPKSF